MDSQAKLSTSSSANCIQFLKGKPTEQLGTENGFPFYAFTNIVSNPICWALLSIQHVVT